MVAGKFGFWNRIKMPVASGLGYLINAGRLSTVRPCSITDVGTVQFFPSTPNNEDERTCFLAQLSKAALKAQTMLSSAGYHGAKKRQCQFPQVDITELSDFLTVAQAISSLYSFLANNDDRPTNL